MHYMSNFVKLALLGGGQNKMLKNQDYQKLNFKEQDISLFK